MPKLRFPGKATYLFQKNPSATKRIILITFTRKAAHEMIERVKKIIPDHYNNIMIGTFHNLAYLVLKHFNKLPEKVRIIDEEEQMSGWDIVAGNEKERMKHLSQQKIFDSNIQLDNVDSLFHQR